MKKIVYMVIVLFVMLSAYAVYADDGGCGQPPGSDPCGCNATQCKNSQACEQAYDTVVAACGILGGIDGCDEAAAIGCGLCEAAVSAAWAGCTAGCS